MRVIIETPTSSAAIAADAASSMCTNEHTPAPTIASRPPAL